MLSSAKVLGEVTQAFQALSVEPPVPTTAFLKSMGIENLPMDRHLTADERMDILSLRISDVPGADIFARRADMTLRSPQEQLLHFQQLKTDLNSLTLDKYLVPYARTRRLDISVRKAELVHSVELMMEQEAKEEKYIFFDTDDGNYEKKRRSLLIEKGALTLVNAPGLVPIKCPDITDGDWRFISEQDITDGFFDEWDCLNMLYRWHDMWLKTSAATSAHLRKAFKKTKSRRAYYLRYCTRDQFMFIHAKVGRSYLKSAQDILLVLEIATGRSKAPPTLLGTTCTLCPVGERHPACSHVLTGLTILLFLQMGIVVAGYLGDGEKAWGSATKLSSLPVQSIERISLLTSSGKMLLYSGFRQNAAPLQSRMSMFIKHYQTRAAPDA